MKGASLALLKAIKRERDFYRDALVAIAGCRVPERDYPGVAVAALYGKAPKTSSEG